MRAGSSPTRTLLRGRGPWAECARPRRPPNPRSSRTASRRRTWSRAARERPGTLGSPGGCSWRKGLCRREPAPRTCLQIQPFLGTFTSLAPSRRRGLDLPDAASGWSVGRRGHIATHGGLSPQLEVLQINFRKALPFTFSSWRRRVRAARQCGPEVLQLTLFTRRQACRQPLSIQTREPAELFL